MTLYAALDDVPIVSGTIVLPYSGIWHADLLLQEPTDSNGQRTLHLSGQAFTCKAIRAVNFSGARGVRVVGGAGGWRQQVGPRQYASGVRVSMVASDVAAEVGESVNVASTDTLGQFTRRQGPAVWTLHHLFGAAWWMDPAGVVQTTARASTFIASDWTAISVQGATGIYTIATEDVADWMPGRTFSGPTASGTINRVEHTITKGALRSTVYVR